MANPKLAPKRKLPDFYHSQSSNDSFYHDHPKNICRELYFEAFNNIINCIKDHFNQTDYQIYVNLPKLLIASFKKLLKDWEDDFHIIKQNYGVNEFYVLLLKDNLLLLSEIAKFYGLW